MNELKLLCDQLEDLALCLDEEDSQVIHRAIDELNFQQIYKDEWDELAWYLERADAEYARWVKEFPDNVHVSELFSALTAVIHVVRFLDRRAPSLSMIRLKAALAALAGGGAPPAMFQPMDMVGRRPDVGNIQAVKGMLAGLMNVKQAQGLSRHEAAKWIAQNISPALAERISKKPITGRTLEEWRDRYGGDHPPDDHGGHAFKTWSPPLHRQLTASELRQITEKISEGLPSLT